MAYVTENSRKSGAVFATGTADMIRGDDDTIGIRYTTHQDFELLGRKDDEEIILPAQ